MAKNNKPKQPTLNEIFQTRNKAKQAERAAQLFSPVVNLIVTFDGRFGTVNVDVVGGQMTPAQARQVLTRAIDALGQKEVELLAQQQAEQQAPPDGKIVPLENPIDIPMEETPSD